MAEAGRSKNTWDQLFVLESKGKNPLVFFLFFCFEMCNVFFLLIFLIFFWFWGRVDKSIIDLQAFLCVEISNQRCVFLRTIFASKSPVFRARAASSIKAAVDVVALYTKRGDLRGQACRDTENFQGHAMSLDKRNSSFWWVFSFFWCFGGGVPFLSVYNHSKVLRWAQDKNPVQDGL